MIIIIKPSIIIIFFDEAAICSDNPQLIKSSFSFNPNEEFIVKEMFWLMIICKFNKLKKFNMRYILFFLLIVQVYPVQIKRSMNNILKINQCELILF